MGDGPLNEILGTGAVWIALAVAFRLSFTREAPDAARLSAAGVPRAALLTLAAQSLHFAEELVGDFHYRFPELLGFEPWSQTFFAAFNLTWITIWAVVMLRLHRPNRWILAPVWLLGISGPLNIVAHPLLATASGGYFPGLWTCPLVGVAGIFLLRALLKATEAES